MPKSRFGAVQYGQVKEMKWKWKLIWNSPALRVLVVPLGFVFVVVVVLPSRQESPFPIAGLRPVLRLPPAAPRWKDFGFFSKRIAQLPLLSCDNNIHTINIMERIMS